MGKLTHKTNSVQIGGLRFLHNRQIEDISCQVARSVLVEEMRVWAPPIVSFVKSRM